jgi:hypothetical protein
LAHEPVNRLVRQCAGEFCGDPQLPSQRYPFSALWTITCEHDTPSTADWKPPRDRPEQDVTTLSRRVAAPEEDGGLGRKRFVSRIV